MAIGTLVSVPGSALLAQSIRREIAPMEREIRSLPIPNRLAILALVPLTEEVIWRGIATGALIGLGIPFPTAVALSIPLGVAAHRHAFDLRGLLTGVVPSSVGIAVAYLLSGNLTTAALVHIAADLEILLPLPGIRNREPSCLGLALTTTCPPAAP